MAILNDDVIVTLRGSKGSNTDPITEQSGLQEARRGKARARRGRERAQRRG